MGPTGVLAAPSALAQSEQGPGTTRSFVFSWPCGPGGAALTLRGLQLASFGTGGAAQPRVVAISIRASRKALKLPDLFLAGSMLAEIARAVAILPPG